MSNARKDEAEAVRTTIVGGRPPGSGRNNVPVPRGIEVLVKKASVDAEFRELLLMQRGKAAATIQLELDPAENAMLSVIPQEQLAQIVDQTTVPMELRSAFKGRVGLVMLAALGVGLAASSPARPIFGQPNPSNAIPPQAQPTNPSSYTGPPMAVAGALPLPDKTTTNAPPANVENTGSSTFSVGDIMDLPAMIDQWRGTSNAVSAFLWQSLSKQDQTVLTNYQPSALSSNQAQAIVVQALNKVIWGPSIYESKRFQGISLRPETTDLMKEGPAGPGTARLNRLLLEDAYPLELSKKSTNPPPPQQIFIVAGLMKSTAKTANQRARQQRASHQHASIADW